MRVNLLEKYNTWDVVDVLENDDIDNRISNEVYSLDGLPEDDDYGDGDNQGDYIYLVTKCKNK